MEEFRFASLRHKSHFLALTPDGQTEL